MRASAVVLIGCGLPDFTVMSTHCYAPGGGGIRPCSALHARPLPQRLREGGYPSVENHSLGRCGGAIILTRSP
jgi:hypothetical protein